MAMTAYDSTVTRLGDLIGQDFFSLPPALMDVAEQEAVDAMWKPRMFEEIRRDSIVACERRLYQKRVGVVAAHICTIVSVENTRWLMKKLTPRIEGKVVVEIGAGLGVLSIEMAKVAKHVFAIDSDPEFTRAFVVKLYQERPANLTWIFDTAQGVIASGLADAMLADVAVIVTGSDERGLRLLAERFVRASSDIIMPWQDYNGNRAICDYRGEDETGFARSSGWPEKT
jgi:SAM-dependent methyltransferase